MGEGRVMALTQWRGARIGVVCWVITSLHCPPEIFCGIASVSPAVLP